MHYENERKNDEGLEIVVRSIMAGKAKQQQQYLKWHTSDQKEQIDLANGIIPDEDQAFIELEKRIKEKQ